LHIKQSNSNMPSQPGWINWRNCEAKEIILFDLRSGVLPLTEQELSTAAAWEIYRHLPAFAGPPIVYSQFAERLADHCAQIRDRVERAQWDAAAMEFDRLHHPYPAHNGRGEPNFHLSPAGRLLRQDVQANRHRGYFPSEFQTTRPEYMVFTKKKFKQLLYQAIRHKKYLNFLHTRGRELPFDYLPHE
jgi:hypothetical protein